MSCIALGFTKCRGVCLLAIGFLIIMSNTMLTVMADVVLGSKNLRGGLGTSTT